MPPPTTTDLAISLKGTSGNFEADTGDSAGVVRYQINVVNNGLASAQNINITQVLPSDGQIVSVSSANGNCTNDGQCNWASLAPSQTDTANVVVKIPNKGGVLLRLVLHRPLTIPI